MANSWFGRYVNVLFCGMLVLMVGCEDGGGGGGNSLVEAVRSIVAGNGQQNAATYVPGPGLHKMKLAKRSANGQVVGVYKGLLHYPDAWEANSISELELVVYEEEYERDTGVTCGPYAGGYKSYYPLHVTVLAVRVIEAKTGQTIAERSFDPGNICPTVAVVSPGQDKIVVGVEYDEAVNWVRQYVSP